MRGRSRTRMAALLAAVLVLIGTGQAWAVVGTEAGTTISNTASVFFTINGNTTSKESDPEEFLVDRKIRPVVANQDTGKEVMVVAGATGVYLTFDVTNESNTPAATTEYFKLSVELGSTDDFDMTSYAIYEDTDGDGDPDGSALTGDGLVVEIPNDGTVKHYLIVAVTPAGAVLGETAAYNLVATAWAGDTVAAGVLEDDALSDDGVNQANASEIVYGDDAAAGDYAGDTAGDGEHSDIGTFVVAEPVSITKAAGNGTSGYHIPGDTVTYTIEVTNNDADYDATAVTIYDEIPSYVKFVKGSLACQNLTDWVAWYSTSAKGSIPIEANWSTTDPDETGTPLTSPVNHVRCVGGPVLQDGGTAQMTFDVVIQ